MSEDTFVRKDRMRFTKNTLSSRLALLAIVFNVLFFISIYKVNHNAYYNFWMGLSILYNLVFMLAAFLASEGVKNYNSRFSVLLILLAAGQIVRMFIYPARIHADPDIAGGALFVRQVAAEAGDGAAAGETAAEVLSQYTRLIIYLSASAVCLLVGAVVNLYKSRVLAAHKAGLGLRQG